MQKEKPEENPETETQALDAKAAVNFHPAQEIELAKIHFSDEQFKEWENSPLCVADFLIEKDITAPVISSPINPELHKELIAFIDERPEIKFQEHIEEALRQYLERNTL